MTETEVRIFTLLLQEQAKIAAIRAKREEWGARLRELWAAEDAHEEHNLDVRAAIVQCIDDIGDILNPKKTDDRE